MTSPAIRHAPLEYWRIAERFLHLLHNLFGAPEAVASQHTLAAQAYTLMASWISAGEALLRRLLLIEAAAYAIAPAARRRSKHTRQRQLMSFEADAPETWRVSLRFPHDRQTQRRNGAARPHHARRFHSAWPLAERYEALLRVFNNPAAYAKRLAHRLRAKPMRIETLLYAPPEYAHRVEQAEDLTEAASRALPKRDSS